MSPFAKQLLWVLFATTWLGILGVQVFRGARSLDRWTRALETQEMLADHVGRDARALEAVVQDIRTQSLDMQFLQGLVNVIPQEKGFVRTQKAISDEVDQLRSKVGRRLKGTLHILVDTRANKLYVKKGLTLLWEADCPVGRGGILIDKRTGRRWEFVTPRGQFEVRNKVEKPLWIKPDWAFVETGEVVPPPEDPKRKVEGELGGYVLNLGDGYLIHGTKPEDLLGRPVSHGCVRLGALDLQQLYETIPKGTRVYIY